MPIDLNIYECSRCGIRRSPTLLSSGYWQTKRGLLCGNIIDYDRVRGTTYCQRKLKLKVKICSAKE